MYLNGFRENDLAWLKTSASQREQMPAIRLIPDAPVEDKLADRRVVGFGYPLGSSKLHFSPGLDTGDTADWLQRGHILRNLFAPRMRVKLGNSGGPTFDFNGRNRGMLSARFDENGGNEHAVVLSMSRIRALLAAE